MGGTTSKYGLRYPGGSDAVTLAVYFEHLAQDVDAALDDFAGRAVMKRTRDSVAAFDIAANSEGPITQWPDVAFQIGNLGTWANGILTVAFDGMLESKLHIVYPNDTVDYKANARLLLNTAGVEQNQIAVVANTGPFVWTHIFEQEVSAGDQLQWTLAVTRAQQGVDPGYLLMKRTG